MLIHIHTENPEPRKIKIVAECLNDGGIIIYPTDTVYSLGCNLYNHTAIEKISSIKNIDPKKANYSLVCHDLSHLSDFVFSIDTPLYRVMKKALPGPYTFILRANNNVPKIFRSKKKTVGIRVPANLISRSIVRELGNPVTSTSIHDLNDIDEYIRDPEIIYEKYGNLADIVIDGGFGNIEPSTVLDCSEGDIVLIRKGLGNLDNIL
ncbi:MAG: L-threonylcarbamoyladenylate synthase [Ignavibacteriae bacterium]|jgi:tRNA threonylcarbamoyl adenosine modification protein (Sua5/YciO/YrdC/YwlC family)|nr:L-threonylcarbamoyladenylate synthase [Ignavibacteriota bacterium]